MNDVFKEILLGAVRHSGTAIGTYLAAKGLTVADHQIEIAIGAVLVAMSVVWSGIQKVWSDQKIKAAVAHASVSINMQQTGARR